MTNQYIGNSQTYTNEVDRLVDLINNNHLEVRDALFQMAGYAYTRAKTVASTRCENGHYSESNNRSTKKCPVKGCNKLAFYA